MKHIKIIGVIAAIMVGTTSIAQLSFVSDYQQLVKSVSRSIFVQNESNITSGTVTLQVHDEATNIQGSIDISTITNTQEDVYAKVGLQLMVEGGFENTDTISGDMEIIVINEPSQGYVRINELDTTLFQKDGEAKSVIEKAKDNRYSFGSLTDELSEITGGIPVNIKDSKQYQQELLTLLAKYPVIKPIGQKSDFGVYTVVLDKSNVTKLTANAMKVFDSSLSVSELNKMRAQTFQDLRKVKSAGTFDTTKQSVSVSLGEGDDGSKLYLQPGLIMAETKNLNMTAQWTPMSTRFVLNAGDEYTTASLTGAIQLSKDLNAVVVAPNNAKSIFELLSN